MKGWSPFTQKEFKLKIGKGQGSKRKGKYTVDPDAPGYKYGPGYEPPVTDKEMKGLSPFTQKSDAMIRAAQIKLEDTEQKIDNIREDANAAGKSLTDAQKKKIVSLQAVEKQNRKYVQKLQGE